MTLSCIFSNISIFLNGVDIDRFSKSREYAEIEFLCWDKLREIFVALCNIGRYSNEKTPLIQFL